MIEDLEPPMCFNCKHKKAEQLKCSAFPDGIPLEILQSSRDHRQPVAGDHGILYDPIDPDYDLPADFSAQQDQSVVL